MLDSADLPPAGVAPLLVMGVGFFAGTFEPAFAGCLGLEDMEASSALLFTRSLSNVNLERSHLFCEPTLMQHPSLLSQLLLLLLSLSHLVPYPSCSLCPSLQLPLRPAKENRHEIQLLPARLRVKTLVEHLCCIVFGFLVGFALGA
jgi:hypothetical protein